MLRTKKVVKLQKLYIIYAPKVYIFIQFSHFWQVQLSFPLINKKIEQTGFFLSIY